MNMKKTTGILAVLFLLGALFAGCGRSEQTYVTEEGKVTVRKGASPTGGGTVEIETEEGKATMTTDTKKTITAAELGAPVYPGATVEATTRYETPQGKTESTVLVTPDSFEKVEAFYKSNLKNPRNTYSVTHEDTKTAMFMMGADDAPLTVTITATQGENKTNIAVMKIEK